MTHVLTFNNSAQILGIIDPQVWFRKYAPSVPDPLWEIYLNGGDDIANVVGLFETGISGVAEPPSLHIFGGTGNDLLEGSRLSDTLDGGLGDDTYWQTNGDDLYIIDSIGDQILGSGGFEGGRSISTDRVQSSVDYDLPEFIDTLVLTGTAAINGSGNSYRNSISGNDGSNILDGLRGADTLIGGLGDDVYVIDNSYDLVVELASQGTDIVETGISYTLTAFVEQAFLNSPGRNQSLTGNPLGNLLVGNSGMNTLSGLDGKDELRGEGGSDSLYGGEGIDTLDGGTGADRMEGGAGNDIYHVDNGLDLVVEAAEGGYDTVFTSTAIAMPDNVEKLVFNGLADGTMLAGNDLKNFLIGNYTDDIIDVGAGSDSVAAGSGDDTLLGGTGSDTLLGEFGIDSIEGGLGRDILSGGAGADIFVFVALTDSNTANRDLIRDFEDDLDRIDLRQIDALPQTGDQALSFIGSDAFTAAGQVRYVTTDLATRIEVSIDADPDPEMLILLNGLHTLTSANFL